ncbi:AAA family ATPase [Pseudomonas alliivorans]|nr:AAA family ATPase [Pseudomonas alliivorans]
MITTFELIKQLKIQKLKTTIKYLHPTLYIIHIDEKYGKLDHDSRVERLSELTKISLLDLNLLEQNSSIELCLLDKKEREEEYSFLDEDNNRHHWIEALAGERIQSQATTKNFKTLHFYGYKGGQARSTVLGTLSKYLAEQGYKILIIDADIEAPSLDKIFQTKATKISETLLGICHFKSCIDTANAYNQKTGKVDLIACRPESEIYDIDFAAFSLNIALDPILLKEGVERISEHAENEHYDFVFIDHRTGSSSSVLPIALTLPGPMISFARRDAQSLAGARIFKSLLSLNLETPGIYVSFALDPEFKKSKLNEESLKIQEELLMQFPEGFRTEVEDAIDNYWIDWPYFKPLVGGIIPDLKKLNAENISSLRDICSVIGLLEELPFTDDSKSNTVKLTSSGSTDGGVYLEADFLKRLLSPNSPITYILGRKGTGKTRLVRELHSRSLGRPILTAADYDFDGGLSSAASTFKLLIENKKVTPEAIWCALLHAAIDSHSAKDKTNSLIRSIEKNLNTQINYESIKDILVDKQDEFEHYTFLIDGIETAFPSTEIKKIIESLFSFLLTIQSDSSLAQKITIRLFLRSDLAKNAIENIEQQLDGRAIPLVWDEQSIFNFVLLRISQNRWFNENFSSACKKLKAAEEKLKNGSMITEEYEPLLMEFFPQKLRASNIQTITFLKTYFSDTVDSTYSPRLYDRFVEFITNKEKVRIKESEFIEANRLGQKLIVQAHQAASEYYLSEVSAELKHMLNPSVDVHKFTEGFNGLSTPFNVEQCILQLAEKTHIDALLVRESMNIMKDIGMFETRPGFSGQWRVGRLFKSSLGMKFVRGSKLTSD